MTAPIPFEAVERLIAMRERRARTEGAAAERARIVAWLRAQVCHCSMCVTDGDDDSPEADAIERGEHCGGGDRG